MRLHRTPWGKRHGKPFRTLWRTSIRTSARKFDALGDWHFVLRPGLLRTILRGKDQKAEFAYLSSADRRAIVEILTATKPGLLKP